MPNLGGPELLIILVVVLLLFGAKKLPDLARSVGRSTSEFKKGVREGGAAEEKESSSAPAADTGPSASDTPAEGEKKTD